jgi:hypothetical protein
MSMPFRRANRVMALLAPAILAAGCSDFGEPASTAPQPNGGLAITDLVPFRTFPGDTVLVQGSGFGAAPGEVFFESSSLRAAEASATIVTWETNRIRVLVPATVASGGVTVRVEGEESNALAFAIAPQVFFHGQVDSLFVHKGCTGCHAFGAASGGLMVLPHSELVSNSAVIPRRSASSRLRQRLLPSTPPSQRMPENGPYLSDAEILLIADWIDQGARNN